MASDSDWLNNDLFQGGNQTLAGNLLHWLAAEDRRLKTQVKRKTEIRSLTIPKPQLGTLRFLSLFPMPFLAFLAGVMVWWTRRGR